MITQWVYHGVVQDFHNEFMIAPSHDSSSRLQKHEEPWQKSLSLIEDRVPSFLKPVADKIFNSGKYLNVLYQCAKTHKSTSHKQLRYSFSGKDYYEDIDKALLDANTSLLEFMFVDKKLLAMLKYLHKIFP